MRPTRRHQTATPRLPVAFPCIAKRRVSVHCVSEHCQFWSASGRLARGGQLEHRNRTNWRRARAGAQRRVSECAGAPRSAWPLQLPRKRGGGRSLSSLPARGKHASAHASARTHVRARDGRVRATAKVAANSSELRYARAQGGGGGGGVGGTGWCFRGCWHGGWGGACFATALRNAAGSRPTVTTNLLCWSRGARASVRPRARVRSRRRVCARVRAAASLSGASKLAPFHFSDGRLVLGEVWSQDPRDCVNWPQTMRLANASANGEFPTEINTRRDLLQSRADTQGDQAHICRTSIPTVKVSER